MSTSNDSILYATFLEHIRNSASAEEATRKIWADTLCNIEHLFVIAAREAMIELGADKTHSLTNIKFKLEKTARKPKSSMEAELMITVYDQGEIVVGTNLKTIIAELRKRISYNEKNGAKEIIQILSPTLTSPSKPINEDNDKMQL